MVVLWYRIDVDWGGFLNVKNLVGWIFFRTFAVSFSGDDLLIFVSNPVIINRKTLLFIIN